MPPRANHAEIVSYWASRVDESGLAVDWAEAHERCWRCAYASVLQRCHIIPEALGGPNDASNLVLLCGRCHREAPNVSDPRLMWIWLRATGVPFYETYWTARGFEEFELMFGRPPFSGDVFKAIDKEAASEAIRNRIRQATVHFGEGRMNPSTIAAIFALMEEDLFGRLPPPVPWSTVSYRMFRAIGMTKEPKEKPTTE